MPDPRESIKAMFEPPNRFASFGNVLMRITAAGFRCHNHTVLDIQSPITAFCGLNGTGKSTLLQLAAVAYASRDLSYTIRDFMVVGTLDPAPFTADATVEYQIWNNSRGLTSRTISRRADGSGWNYPRRPERSVFFAGIGQYLPRIEQRDFIVRHAPKLVISESHAVSQTVKDWTGKILSSSYEQITANTVTYTENSANRTGQIVTVQRHGVVYSEAHMGFGEGRTQYLIAAIEALPDKSLVIIEEPETALHPSAQLQFGQYLVDVVARKRHQIFLSTHSVYLLMALPPQSRVYLQRREGNVELQAGLPSTQIRCLLAEGQVKALEIFVEDDCASAILREGLRLVDPSLLEAANIHTAGSWQTVGLIAQTMLEAEMPVAGVVDADQAANPKKNVFRLPGRAMPPEKALFDEQAVKDKIRSEYRLDLDDFAMTVMHMDHHGWPDRLATRLQQNKGSLLTEMARAFATAHVPEMYALADQLKSVLR